MSHVHPWHGRGCTQLLTAALMQQKTLCAYLQLQHLAMGCTCPKNR